MKHLCRTQNRHGRKIQKSQGTLHRTLQKILLRQKRKNPQYQRGNSAEKTTQHQRTQQTPGTKHLSERRTEGTSH